MTNKKLAILGLIAAAMVVWAVVQARLANRQVTSAKEPSYLIQGLNPETVARIEVKSPGKEVLMKRQGDSFVITNKENYPARSDRINELFAELLDVRTTELITSNSVNLEELQMTEDKAAHVVKFFDDKDRLITGAVIGQRTDEGTCYVRLADSSNVYLTEKPPWVWKSILDFIEQELIKTNPQEIASVSVTDSNGLSYTLESDPNSGQVILAAGNPEGKKLSNDAGTVFSALSNLSLLDVTSEQSAPNDLVFDRTYICRLKDSTVYILKIARTAEDTFVQCSATFTEKEDITIDKTESDRELKRKEAKLLAMDAVDKLNQKCRGWVYKISPYLAKNITKPYADLFEKEKQEQTAED